MVGLAGLWEQLALHRVLSPIPSSIQVVGCGGRGGCGSWSSDAQPRPGSFAGDPQCLPGWDFIPPHSPRRFPQAPIPHQAPISCPPASLCQTPRAWSSLEGEAQARRQTLRAAGSFCPLFLDTAAGTRPNGLHFQCQFPGKTTPSCAKRLTLGISRTAHKPILFTSCFC